MLSKIEDLEQKKKLLKLLNTLIGKQLRTLRETAKLSQNDIAKFFGVQWQQVLKYESGKNRISAANLAIVFEEFGVLPNEFYLPVMKTFRWIVNENLVDTLDLDQVNIGDEIEYYHLMNAIGDDE